MNIVQNQIHAANPANELIQLTQQLEKFKQETEYVCLKLAVKDWITFLAEVRKGYIVRTFFNSNPSLPSAANTSLNKSKTKEQSPNTIKKVTNTHQILNEVLQIKQTKRNVCHNRNCDCQSPICSEERIKHIKGSDTSRSESSCMQVPTFEQEDPFQKYKLQNLCTNNIVNQKLVQELMRNFDHDRNQKTKEVPAFDTFRKIVNEDKDTNELYLSSSRNNHQSTAKKSYANSNFPQFQSPSFERVNSEQWINKSTVQMEQGMKQFLLALQNTKLRKEIKYLQKMLNTQS